MHAALRPYVTTGIASGACRHLLGRVTPLVLIAGAVLLPGRADAAPDPIIGDWNVVYGAPATVTMTLADGVYTETANTPVRVVGSSCDLPPGTVIATFTQTGPGTYAGQHGLWYRINCAFHHWAGMALSLDSDGNTLTAKLDDGESATFTRGGWGPAPLPPSSPQLPGSPPPGWNPPMNLPGFEGIFPPGVNPSTGMPQDPNIGIG